MPDIIFHNCKPADESALVASLDGNPLTEIELDRLTTALNSEAVKEAVAKAFGMCGICAPLRKFFVADDGRAPCLRADDRVFRDRGHRV